MVKNTLYIRDLRPVIKPLPLYLPASLVPKQLKCRKFFLKINRCVTKNKILTKSDLSDIFVNKDTVSFK